MAEDYGYIRLHRQLKEKAFYKDSEKVHLWIHLLMKATHKGREELLGGKPFRCEAGQFTIGRKQLAEETGIDESKCERILTYFEKIEQQIEQRKTTKNRLISILNWSKYQHSEQHFEQQLHNNCTTSEQQVNNNCTTSEQQVNTLQECINVLNVENEKNVKNDKNNNLPFEEIVKYLNLRAGTNYKHTTEKTKTLIKARFKEKFNLEDFKKCIDNMCSAWLNNDKMAQYLRPETLFGTKFESYVNYKTSEGFRSTSEIMLEELRKEKEKEMEVVN